MTLEEAIIHAKDVAEEIEHDAKEYNRLAKLETYPSRKECESAYKRCCKCAKEHRQLAEWLKLLKRILDSGDCNDCAMLHRQCRYAPRWGEQVRYNCPFYAEEKIE